MAYSFHNGFCHQCEEFVPKGPDTSKRLWANGAWRTFCIKCGPVRQTNKNKGTSKRAYIKRQPTLFD
jgi:RNase P subunit RPR2